MKVISKHLPLLALALLVSFTELRAEESQLPIKVGDVVALYDAPSSSTNSTLVFIVKQIKGRWISLFEGEDITGKKGEIYRWGEWLNTDHYMRIDINRPEDLSHFGFTQPIPNPNAKPTFTYSVINGKTTVTTNIQTTNAPIQVLPQLEANTNQPQLYSGRGIRGLNKGKPYPIQNKNPLQIVTPPLPDLPDSEKSTEKDAPPVGEESK